MSYDDETPCGPLGKPIPGYRAGNVIVRQEGEWDGAESSGSYGASAEVDDEGVASYEDDDASAETSGRAGSDRSRSSAGGLSRLWSTSGDSCRSSATCALQ